MTTTLRTPAFAGLAASVAATYEAIIVPQWRGLAGVERWSMTHQPQSAPVTAA